MGRKRKARVEERAWRKAIDEELGRLLVGVVDSLGPENLDRMWWSRHLLQQFTSITVHV